MDINLYYQSNSNESFLSNNDLELNRESSSETDYTSNRLFTSKIHQFENFPEPRNATEGITIVVIIINFFLNSFIK